LPNQTCTDFISPLGASKSLFQKDFADQLDASGVSKNVPPLHSDALPNYLSSAILFENTGRGIEKLVCSEHPRRIAIDLFLLSFTLDPLLSVAA
jgi:hypothetical protein